MAAERIEDLACPGCGDCHGTGTVFEITERGRETCRCHCTYGLDKIPILWQCTYCKALVTVPLGIDEVGTPLIEHIAVCDGAPADLQRAARRWWDDCLGEWPGLAAAQATVRRHEEARK